MKNKEKNLPPDYTGLAAWLPDIEKLKAKWIKIIPLDHGFLVKWYAIEGKGILKSEYDFKTIRSYSFRTFQEVLEFVKDKIS